ncbi:MAG: carbon-nitrogen hydrolase family protein [Deltaproteobacteria bacterium]|nr:carbon-nitrogen hydrolase family protein [Deltaproteobacteria bacterium]
MPDFKVKVAELAFPEDRCCVGLANLEAMVGNISANQERIRQALACFRDHGVNLAVFPELSLSGYFWDDEAGCRSYMETAGLENQRGFIDGAVCSALDDTLRFVVLNILRQSTDPGEKRFVNSTLVVGRTASGARVEAFYDKAVLPGIEKRYLVGGGGRRLVLETEWGRFGFLTCYDICYPSMLLGYHLLDRVDGIILAASWRGPALRRYPGLGLESDDYYGHLWESLIPAQAATSQAWFFAANAVGRHAVSGDVFWGGQASGRRRDTR